MGIYIPNMEMPKEGRLTLQISANGSVYVVNSCSITAETYTTDAVPIPPHGRLGDLDELARKIEHDQYNHTHADGLAARHHIAEYGHFLREIAYTPTVIPAEEGET